MTCGQGKIKPLTIENLLVEIKDRFAAVESIENRINPGTRFADFRYAVRAGEAAVSTVLYPICT